MNKRELKELVRYALTAAQQDFKKSVERTPAMRKLALQFHRASMTPAQKRAYDDIKKTRGAWDNGEKITPTLTVGKHLLASDAAKAVTVLELEQPYEQGGFLVTWECDNCVNAINKRNSRWF